MAYAGDEITDAQVRELLGVVAESVLDELVEAIAEQSSERALGLVHRLHRRRAKPAAFLPRGDPPFPQSAGRARLRRGFGTGCRAAGRAAAPGASMPRNSAKRISRAFSISCSKPTTICGASPIRACIWSWACCGWSTRSGWLRSRKFSRRLRGEPRPAETGAAGVPAATDARSSNCASCLGVFFDQFVWSDRGAHGAGERIKILALHRRLRRHPLQRTASNSPMPASPPRIVARAAETAAGGLAVGAAGCDQNGAAKLEIAFVISRARDAE